MDIHGFTSELEYIPEGSTLLLDGNSFVWYLCEQVTLYHNNVKNDRRFGGDYVSLDELAKRELSRLQNDFGFTVIVFLDGPQSYFKGDASVRRRKTILDTWYKFHRLLHGSSSVELDDLPIPLLAVEQFQQTLAEINNSPTEKPIRIIQSKYEASKDMAVACVKGNRNNEANGSTKRLYCCSGDTDFLGIKDCAFIHFSSLHKVSLSPLQIPIFRRRKAAEALKLSETQFVELTILLGNNLTVAFDRALFDRVSPEVEWPPCDHENSLLMLRDILVSVGEVRVCSSTSPELQTAIDFSRAMYELQNMHSFYSNAHQTVGAPPAITNNPHDNEGEGFLFLSAMQKKYIGEIIDKKRDLILKQIGKGADFSVIVGEIMKELKELNAGLKNHKTFVMSDNHLMAFHQMIDILLPRGNIQSNEDCRDKVEEILYHHQLQQAVNQPGEKLEWFNVVVANQYQLIVSQLAKDVQQLLTKKGVNRPNYAYTTAPPKSLFDGKLFHHLINKLNETNKEAALVMATPLSVNGNPVVNYMHVGIDRENELNSATHASAVAGGHTHDHNSHHHGHSHGHHDQHAHGHGGSHGSQHSTPHHGHGHDSHHKHHEGTHKSPTKGSGAYGNVQDDDVPDAQQRAILKSTEELVTQARLMDIANKHRSIGSILDVRTIHPLEEPKKHDKTVTNKDVEKRVNARRGGKGEFDIQAKADEALNAFRSAGVNVNLLVNDYTLEMQLWKEKSGQPSYSQKRKYQYPELEKFREKMTTIQKNLFKEKIGSAIIALADKYRAECQAAKEEMDRAGIFHPEANAHRVHCMYLLKLHKGIRSDTIEDPILRAFLHESLQLDRNKREEEERKEKLLSIIESSGGTAIKKQDLVNMEKELALANDAFAKSLLPKAGSSTPLHLRMKKSDHENPKAEQVRLARSQSAALLTKNKMTQRLKPMEKQRAGAGGGLTISASATITMGKAMSLVALDTKSPSGKSVPGGGLAVGAATSEEDEYSQGGSPDRAGGGGGGGGLNKGNPSDRLFKKIKRDRLGFADPRSLLTEEATKLERAESAPLKKTKDKNNLLDSEMATWMTATLQKPQIAKTAQGTALLAGGGILGSTKPTSSSSSSLLMDFIGTIREDEASLTSPQKMLPFDEFYSMFQSYSQKTLETAAANLTAAESRTPDVKKGSLVVAGLSNIKLPAESEGQAPTSVTTVTATGAAAAPFETVNIVKALSRVDPGFEVFLNLKASTKEREAVQTTSLARSLSTKLTAPRKVIKVAPLGKEALNLKDSRGRASKHATKGFKNLFKGTDDDDAPGEDSMDDISVSTTESERAARDKNGRSDDEHSDSGRDSPYYRGSGGGGGGGGGGSHSAAGAGGSGTGSVGRTSSRGRSRRGFGRKAKKAVLADDAVVDTDNAIYQMQDKLLAIWDSLQVPTMSRIEFMRKYSTEAYSIEMGKAIDMWGEAAVIVLVLCELTSLLKKVKSGLFSMPLSCVVLIPKIKSKIPVILSTTSLSLVPPAIVGGKISAPTLDMPLSALAWRQCVSQLEHSFSEAATVDNGTVVTSVPEAIRVIQSAISAIGLDLKDSVHKTLTELDDAVTFGNKTCRDWVSQTVIPEAGVQFAVVEE